MPKKPTNEFDGLFYRTTHEMTEQEFLDHIKDANLCEILPDGRMTSREPEPTDPDVWFADLVKSLQGSDGYIRDDVYDAVDEIRRWKSAPPDHHTTRFDAAFRAGRAYERARIRTHSKAVKGYRASMSGGQKGGRLANKHRRISKETSDEFILQYHKYCSDGASKTDARTWAEEDTGISKSTGYKILPGEKNST